ncbi:MAG: hypothetical protein PHV59_04990 [Victivallales bacterium]|nr:hypothetical protein [Victivallales bacterium]
MSENIKLDEQLSKNASSPKSVESDGQKFEQHSLQDQIEVDRYLNSKAAAKRKNSGLKLTKLSAPGA